MQTIVGVLRGGPSREHERSLATGANVIAGLPEERFTVHDLYVDKQGVWYDRGRPTTPERALRQLDAVILGLHGQYGEDGEAQKVLERFGVPHAGTISFNARVGSHKLLAKMQAREAGLLTPNFRHIEQLEDAEAAAQEIIRSFAQPVVVKPVERMPGSSITASGYAPLMQAIKDLFDAGAPSLLVEEHIRGQRATVGVVEGLRGEALYVLPTVETVPQGGRQISPGNFSRVDTEELQRLARLMHRTLGMRHYSQSEFIVAPQGVYYIETAPLPDLSPESPMLRALESVGVPAQDFFVHLVRLARLR